jgi:hypothetical protein
MSHRARLYQDPVLGPAVLTQGLPVTTGEELLTVSLSLGKLAQRASVPVLDEGAGHVSLRQCFL